mmetsp:Transcript_448/g.1192  ORF Transcript_448/g.1192 Transcript_448/m.1192 type:complete len:205 (+) Transcript_448:902-1516(+)
MTHLNSDAYTASNRDTVANTRKSASVNLSPGIKNRLVARSLSSSSSVCRSASKLSPYASCDVENPHLYTPLFSLSNISSLKASISFNKAGGRSQMSEDRPSTWMASRCSMMSADSFETIRCSTTSISSGAVQRPENPASSPQKASYTSRRSRYLPRKGSSKIQPPLDAFSASSTSRTTSIQLALRIRAAITTRWHQGHGFPTSR